MFCLRNTRSLKCRVFCLCSLFVRSSSRTTTMAAPAKTTVSMSGDTVYSDLETAAHNGMGLASTPDGSTVGPSGTVRPMGTDSPVPTSGKEMSFIHVEGKNAHTFLLSAYDHIVEMQDTNDENSDRMFWFTRCYCPGGPCCRQVKSAFVCRGCCKCCCRCTLSKSSLKGVICCVLVLALIFSFVAAGVLGGNTP
jgi:hypothetical protein